MSILDPNIGFNAKLYTHKQSASSRTGRLGQDKRTHIFPMCLLCESGHEVNREYQHEQYVLCNNFVFFNGIQGPGAVEQMRETCRNHPTLIVSQDSFMVLNYISKASFRISSKKA